MILHNIRLGFATNSSSTHSLVFLNNIDDQNLDNYHFGWNHFTAASKEAKRAYVALHVGSALSGIIDEETAGLVIKGLFGGKLAKNIKDGYIDHQSLYALPYDWEGKGLNYKFLKDFERFMTRDNLVILGGNDNDEESHPLNRGRGFYLPIPQDSYRDGWVARKDSQGFWTMFNRGAGGKVRFSFDDLNMDIKYSTTPELIDLKITDFCEKNCKYCYQSSSPFGKHAEWGRPVHYQPCKSNGMYNFLEGLKKLKVFEVAIGGGEPTDHPRFLEILKDFREAGIVPNFSTGNLKWMENDEMREKVSELAGNFAYSAKDAHDIERFVNLISIYKSKSIWRRPVLHYVLGTSYDFNSFLEEAKRLRVGVVLLGYKNNGRGSGYIPHDYSDWVDVIVKLKDKGKCPNISIDTPLASQFSKELKEAGVNDLFVSRTEGSFSMYIDLVEGKMGPSSFCDEKELVNFDAYGREVEKSIRKCFPFTKE